MLSGEKVNKNNHYYYYYCIAYFSLFLVLSNMLESLPNWIGTCFFIERVDVSHNCIRVLPER